MTKVPDPVAETAIRQLEVTALHFAYQATNIASVRAEYTRRTQELTTNLRAAYLNGEMSAKAAAQTANEMRNVIMEQQRVKSASLGRSMARQLKAKGLDLDIVTEKAAQALFKKPFAELDNAQQTAAYLEVVESAGRARPGPTRFARRAGVAGRALFILGIGLAVYDIANSEDKVWQTGRELSNMGGGIAGGVAAGALAGIWLGPVGVAVGAFVGGVAGALISDQAYVAVVGASDRDAGRFLKRFTTFLSTDEQGIADALYREVGINMDRVHAIFLAMDESYSTDADDVAMLYLRQVIAGGGPVLEALKLNIACRATLIRILDEGWTSQDEARMIGTLRSLR